MKKYASLILKIIIAIILLQTLPYKFLGAQESVDLFTKVAGKNETFVRFFTGVLELLAVVLLFIPKKTWLGAILTVALMGGAIISHLTKIGIEHNNDNGLLFISAVISLIAAVILLIQAGVLSELRGLFSK